MWHPFGSCENKLPRNESNYKYLLTNVEKLHVSVSKWLQDDDADVCQYAFSFKYLDETT